MIDELWEQYGVRDSLTRPEIDDFTAKTKLWTSEGKSEIEGWSRRNVGEYKIQ